MIKTHICAQLLLCAYFFCSSCFVSGTENGFVQKAVNFDGEMFIIEEIQVHENPNPILTMRLSTSKVKTGPDLLGSSVKA